MAIFGTTVVYSEEMETEAGDLGMSRSILQGIKVV
jgi:hypothetical protein